MLPLLCAWIVFAFLAVGAVVFVVCALIPPLRRYGLSAALWCAVWGPCTVACIIIAGLGVVASDIAMRTAESSHLHPPELPRQTWTGYEVAAVIGVAAVASFAFIIHQWLIHRLTLALFRIYAALVSAGIGSVFGLCLGLWLMAEPAFPFKFGFWALGMLGLCGGFGYAALCWASLLRGEAPRDFTFIFPEEFQEVASP